MTPKEGQELRRRPPARKVRLPSALRQSKLFASCEQSARNAGARTLLSARQRKRNWRTIMSALLRWRLCRAAPPRYSRAALREIIDHPPATEHRVQTRGPKNLAIAHFQWQTPLV